MRLTSQELGNPDEGVRGEGGGGGGGCGGGGGGGSGGGEAIK